MMPQDWGKIPEKPICPVCACVQFTEEFICLGCGEPLVVRPYVKKPASRMIAAERWGKHWPINYEKRCFLCGWKSNRILDSLIPKNPEDFMAAGMWANRPEAIKLANAVCPDRVLSERFKMIVGILAHTGENALFKAVAHNQYAKLAQKYDNKQLSFCRKCAEEDAKPLPAEAPEPNAVSLTDTMASAMKAAAPQPVKTKESIPMRKIGTNSVIPRAGSSTTSPSSQDDDKAWDEGWETDEEWVERSLDEDEPDDEEEEWYEEEEEEEEEFEPNEEREEASDWGEW